MTKYISQISDKMDIILKSEAFTTWSYSLLSSLRFFDTCRSYISRLTAVTAYS